MTVKELKRILNTLEDEYELSADEGFLAINGVDIGYIDMDDEPGLVMRRADGQFMRARVDD